MKNKWFYIWILAILIALASVVISRGSDANIKRISVILLFCSVLMPLFGFIVWFLNGGAWHTSEKLRKEFNRKIKLIAENEKIMSTAIKYGNRKLFLSELEPYFYLGKSGGRAAIMKIRKNTQEIQKINSTIVQDTHKIIEAESEELAMLNYIVLHDNVQNISVQNLEQAQIQDLGSILNHLSSEEKSIVEEILKLRDKILNSREYLINSINCEGRDITKIISLTSPFENIVFDEHHLKENLASELRKIGYEVLPEESTKKAVEKINEFVRKIEETSNTERDKVEYLINTVFTERDKLKKKLGFLKEIPKAKEKHALLFQKSRAAFAIQTADGRTINIANIAQLLMEIERKSFNHSSFDVNAKTNIANFIMEIEGGELLAKKIMALVTKTGKEGVEQLLNIIRTYTKS